MINYTPHNQLTIEGFETPFTKALDRNNRWVLLANVLPWDRFAEIYYKDMSSTMGAGSKSARVAIGAVIVKHKLNLSDVETIEQIKENPYLQFFLGFQFFTMEAAFDPSLFVKIRERLGQEEFEKFTSALIEAVETAKTDFYSKKKAATKKDKASGAESATDHGDGKGTDARGVKKVDIVDGPAVDESARGVKEVNTVDGPTVDGSAQGVKKVDTVDESAQDEAVGTENLKGSDAPKKEESPLCEASEITHKGHLIVDATVADQYIKYPTDHGLLNECREKCEIIIDVLYQASEMKKKPRTYRRKARKEFLQVCRKKKKTKKEIRKAVGKQLHYVHRDIGIIYSLMDSYGEKRIPLNRKTWKLFWVIQEIYRQQEEMYRTKTHRCSDRIVSLYQPHVRPIVRGKEGCDVEFGSQIGVGLDNGYAHVQRISWNAYHEASDLEEQLETYKRLHGYYPEVVLADQKYWTKENRKKLKELGIRCSGKKLGRPKAEGPETKEERKRNRKEHGMRNAIEGKFGQGKNGYDLDEIRAKKPETSESMIMSIFFVMNILCFMKDMLIIFLFSFCTRTANFIFCFKGANGCTSIIFILIATPPANFIFRFRGANGGASIIFIEVNTRYFFSEP